jgi:cytidylate kinase
MEKEKEREEINEYSKRPLLITIDGPAGAGKTTVSRLIAAKLAYRYVDTGALYRCIALAAKDAGLETDDDHGLTKLCSGLDLRLEVDGRDTTLVMNGKAVSQQIRTPEITMMASAVSARPVVRKYLLKLQRELGASKAAVFEGRDMGTVVFPQADIKFYLDADLETRALRRYKELPEHSNQTLEQVESDMRRRDANDSHRELAPLKPAADAIIIDATHLSIDQVIATLLSHIKSFALHSA